MNAKNLNTSLSPRGLALHPHVLAIAVRHNCIAEFQGDLRHLGPKNMGGYRIIDGNGKLVAGENFHLKADDVFVHFGEPVPEVSL
ncbi:hypothetical protein [Pseudomonas brassicacearum]|uniref:Uncharacterized protein n=1 Tax=Pseudomonas brassicacearum TaxID=930166 RepID=A0A423H1Y8_9PSED|nr:hypothetical protein [Pseudomonas brassicacearum]RON06242.1 hypothetical protein BK658_00185 [Pseudomonas brassicacearum]